MAETRKAQRSRTAASSNSICVRCWTITRWGCWSSSATVSRSTFANLTKQAIEVRESGRLDMQDSSIRRCHQGVSAYGGAAYVGLSNVEISGNNREGVLVCGSKLNGSSRAQKAIFKNDSRNTVSSIAQEAAVRAGKDLDVAIIGCSVVDNQMFGLSLDGGATVSVCNSLIDNNAPFGIYIKGETNLALVASRVVYGKRTEGVHVAINYGGRVDLKHVVFAGKKREKALVEEFHQLAQLQRTTGMWSRPAVQSETTWFSDSRELPSLPPVAHNASCAKRANSSPTQSSTILDMLSTTRRVHFQGGMYYAIGNTFGYDVLQSLEANQTSQPIEVLLGGCGDVRNVFKTVHVWASSADAIGKLRITLNDRSMSILARQVLLIELAASRSVSATDLVAIWASHALTTAQRTAVTGTCNRLSHEPLPAWLSLPDDDVEAMRSCFRAWAACSVSLKVYLSWRQSHFGGGLANACLMQFDASVSLSARALSDSGINMAQRGRAKELRAYIVSGSLTATSMHSMDVNPTLMEAPDMRYELYWSSSIYRSVQLAEGDLHETLHEMLCRTVADQMDSVASALEKSTLSFHAVPGGLVEHLATVEDGSETIHYDAIDCSNVADYTSLPSLLIEAVARLHTRLDARVYLQSTQLDVAHLKSAAEYMRGTLGMQLATWEALSGAELVTAATTATNAASAPTTLNMVWKKSNELRVASPWLTDGYLLLELLGAAKTHCDMMRHGVNLCGRGYSAANIVARLLVQASPESAVDMVRALVAVSPEAKLHKWELPLAAKLFVGKGTQLSTLVRVRFTAKVDFYRLMRTSGSPLVLVFSKRPLQCGNSRLPITRGAVVQVIDSFTFDPETHVVEFLSAQTLLDLVSAYYATLCASCIHGDDRHNTPDPKKELLALSESNQLSSASTVPVETDELPPAMNNGRMGIIRSSMSTPLAPVDGEWHINILHVSADYVTIDVQLPIIPFPPSDQASFVMKFESHGPHHMCVIVVERIAGVAQYAEDAFTHRFEVALPCPVDAASFRVKLSRRLSLASVRVARLVE